MLLSHLRGLSPLSRRLVLLRLVVLLGLSHLLVPWRLAGLLVL
ncbi:hypothetical protein [Sphaerisporangium dianthi]|uniref:Uncharacterized protein n=1 Tax=Sphaerisporangium dianthi TaxID=1436120 RepID=A0ABV9CUI8_9ACTN